MSWTAVVMSAANNVTMLSPRSLAILSTSSKHCLNSQVVCVPMGVSVIGLVGSNQVVAQMYYEFIS